MTESCLEACMYIIHACLEEYSPCQPKRSSFQTFYDDNHFNQTGHTLHNIRGKGLWLLFTDSVNNRKDMESHLIDKLGSRKLAGMNERI